MTTAPVGDVRFLCTVQVEDYLADEGLMQRLAVAYAERICPNEAAAPDADFLRVCPLPHVPSYPPACIWAVLPQR